MERAPSAGPVNLVSLIEQRCNIMLSTVVSWRAPLLAVHRHSMAYRRHVLAERRVRAEGLSGNAIAELERALAVLERFGRTYQLPDSARAAWSRRMRQLGAALEIEQGKSCTLDGQYAAARRHLQASADRALKVRIATVVLLVAFGVLRRACLALHPGVGQRRVPRPAGDKSWNL
jgi:hypothetical protein